MFSKLVLTGAIAIPLGLFALSAGASADSWNPTGSYNPKETVPMNKGAVTRRSPPVALAPTHRAVLSCKEASRLVRKNGYDHIVARNCGGKTHVFRAQRNGRPVTVSVDPRSGRMWAS